MTDFFTVVNSVCLNWYKCNTSATKKRVWHQPDSTSYSMTHTLTVSHSHHDENIFIELSVSYDRTTEIFVPRTNGDRNSNNDASKNHNTSNDRNYNDNPKRHHQ